MFVIEWKSNQYYITCKNKLNYTAIKSVIVDHTKSGWEGKILK